MIKVAIASYTPFIKNIDDEMEAIRISNKKGCHEKILIDFASELLKEE